MSRSIDADSLNNQLVFSLPMFEGTGTATVRDVARPHHPVTQVHAPVWTQISPSGLWCLDFDSTHPDYLSVPAASAADVDFTTSDFTMVVWVNTTITGAFRTIMSKGSGAVGNKGWWFWGHGTVQYHGLNTYPASAACYAVGGLTGWWLAGHSRIGATGYPYDNGMYSPRNVAAASPITADAAANFTIGIRSDLTLPFDGLMWNPRIWSRALSPAEHRSIFNRERHLFGV
jgi:hypothetical protein